MQVLKEVLTHHNDTEHESRQVFEAVFEKIDVDGRLKHELVDQFKTVIAEKPAKLVEQLGSQLARTVERTWNHFNLREQSELLQLLLLYTHQTGDCLPADWSRLCNMFSSHQFCTGRQAAAARAGEVGSEQLAATVGQLEAALLVQLLDLSRSASATLFQTLADLKVLSSLWCVSHDSLAPRATSNKKGDTAEDPELAKAVTGLGELAAHHPAMLAWMLVQFMWRGGTGLTPSTQRLGELALAGGVLQYLLATLQSPACSGHTLLGDILHSLVYGLLAALVQVGIGDCVGGYNTTLLVQAFDPAGMGLALDTHRLVVKILSHRLIAQHFWKDPCGLKVYYDEVRARFPLEQAPFLEVVTGLASASSSSCQQLVPALSSLPGYCAALDTVPGTAQAVPGGLELTATWYPYPATQSVAVPAGVVGVVAGGLVTFPCAQSGWQLLLAEVGHLASQLERGAAAVQPDWIARAARAAELVAAVLTVEPGLGPQLGHITMALLATTDRQTAITNLYRLLRFVPCRNNTFEKRCLEKSV